MQDAFAHVSFNGCMLDGAKKTNIKQIQITTHHPLHLQFHCSHLGCSGLPSCCSAQGDHSLSFLIIDQQKSTRTDVQKRSISFTLYKLPHILLTYLDHFYTSDSSYILHTLSREDNLSSRPNIYSEILFQYTARQSSHYISAWNGYIWELHYT